jgi:homoserine kinase
MSTHLLPDNPYSAADTGPMDLHARHRSPQRQGIGSTAAVTIAAIFGVVAVAALLVLTGNAKDATTLATLAILVGVGLAIGFRKQWTR